MFIKNLEGKRAINSDEVKELKTVDEDNKFKVIMLYEIEPFKIEEIVIASFIKLENRDAFFNELVNKINAEYMD